MFIYVEFFLFFCRHAGFWSSFQQNSDGSADAGNENGAECKDLSRFRLPKKHERRRRILGKGK